MKRRVISPFADTYQVPDKTALRGKLESQLVFGEIFEVEDEKNGWCKGACQHDGYPGWVESAHLGAEDLVTHVVTVARTDLYRDATMKSPRLSTFSFGSRVRVGATGNGYAQTPEGWIFEKHLSPVDAVEQDYLAAALKFLDTPYVWGGRSGFGIDCSGLVQVVLARAGISVPRDTEDQEGVVGVAADGPPQRGDIVYFPSHVGIMTDEKNILHATAFVMKVAIEPLTVVAERSGGVNTIRRVAGGS